jgi:hypothetical protein
MAEILAPIKAITNLLCEEKWPALSDPSIAMQNHKKKLTASSTDQCHRWHQECYARWHFTKVSYTIPHFLYYQFASFFLGQHNLNGVNSNWFKSKQPEYFAEFKNLQLQLLSRWRFRLAALLCSPQANYAQILEWSHRLK